MFCVRGAVAIIDTSVWLAMLCLDDKCLPLTESSKFMTILMEASKGNMGNVRNDLVSKRSRLR